MWNETLSPGKIISKDSIEQLNLNIITTPEKRPNGAKLVIAKDVAGELAYVLEELPDGKYKVYSKFPFKG